MWGEVLPVVEGFFKEVQADWKPVAAALDKLRPTPLLDKGNSAA